MRRGNFSREGSSNRSKPGRAPTGLAVLLTATLFVRNLYCRFLCPLGAFIALAGIGIEGEGGCGDNLLTLFAFLPQAGGVRRDPGDAALCERAAGGGE